MINKNNGLYKLISSVEEFEMFYIEILSEVI